MKVKDFKELVRGTFDTEEYDECDIVVPINGSNLDIVGIDNHKGNAKPGELPFELIIK